MVKRIIVVKNEINIKTSREMKKPQPNAEKKRVTQVSNRFNLL